MSFAQEIARMIETALNGLRVPAENIIGQLRGTNLPPAGAGVPYAAASHTHPGGGALDITDGVTTVTAVTSLTLDGATITDDTGGAATLTVTGGGGGSGVPSGDQVRTVLYENTLGSAGTWDVSGISGSYDDLEIEIFGRDTNGATLGGVQIFFNNDTTAGNYAGVRHYMVTGTGIGASSEDVEIGFIDGGSTNSNAFSRVEVRIPAYAGATWKTVAADSYAPTLGALAKHTTAWKNTAAITRVAFTTRGTNFAAGSRIRIVGVKTQP